MPPDDYGMVSNHIFKQISAAPICSLDVPKEKISRIENVNKVSELHNASKNSTNSNIDVSETFPWNCPAYRTRLSKEKGSEWRFLFV